MGLFLVKWDQDSDDGMDESPPPEDGEYEVPDEAIASTKLGWGSPYGEWIVGREVDADPDKLRTSKAAHWLSDKFEWRWLIKSIKEYDVGIGGRKVRPIEEGLADVDPVLLHDEEYEIGGEMDRYYRRFTILNTWSYEPHDMFIYLVHVQRQKVTGRLSQGYWRQKRGLAKPFENIFSLRITRKHSSEHRMERGIGNRLVEPRFSSSKEFSQNTLAMVAWRHYPTPEQLNRAISKACE